jgi:hypothetical protein
VIPSQLQLLFHKSTKIIRLTGKYTEQKMETLFLFATFAQSNFHSAKYLVGYA